MIIRASGDLFLDPAEAWVNAVNCVGVMNAGVAKMFRTRFPLYFLDYETKCADGLLRTGEVDAYYLREPAPTNFIVSFPTMLNPGEATQESELIAGLTSLVDLCNRLDLFDIAVPALGCGIGQFDFNRLLELMLTAFDGCSTIVRLYEPHNWRKNQPT